MGIKKRILITGASGFVGQFVARSLDSTNLYDVRLAGRNINTVNLLSTNVEQVLVEDLSSTTSWEKALQGCHCVIHTAARVHMPKKKERYALDIYRQVNVEASIHLAQQAVMAGVTRFIYISSIKVNGEGSLGHAPFRADDIPNPQDAYSVSKYEAEEGLKKIAAETGLEVVIIRPPLIYGPGVKGNFKLMLHWLQKGYPVFITKKENKRSLVGLKNLSDLIETCIHHPKATNEIFLVSDGMDLSTYELINFIGKNMNQSARLVFIPYVLLFCFLSMIGKKSVMDRLYGSLQVNIEKNEKILGWKPKHDVSEMIQETVEDFIHYSS